MPSISPRRRDRAATEADILASAERLLLREGWAGLNVQTLASEAGVDRKLIYRYFDGVEGAVERLSNRLDLWLGDRLAAVPTGGFPTYRAFARTLLFAYLAALRAQPLLLRLLAWETGADAPLLARLEASRSAVIQAWVRDRRGDLAIPPDVDVAALNAVLLAALQHLALAGASRGRFAGLALNAAGWARIETALDRLLLAYPD